METWEKFQARLFHLGYLAEELPTFAATPGGAWLYRQIAGEAAVVAQIAAEYVAEAERAALATPPVAGPTTGNSRPDPFTDARNAETSTAGSSGATARTCQVELTADEH